MRRAILFLQAALAATTPAGAKAQPVEVERVRELTLPTSVGGFGHVGGGAIGDDGSVFLLDFVAFRVFHFDGRGAFRRGMGRRGDGPGEFEAPRGIAIGPDGHVVVADGDRLVSWTGEGRAGPVVRLPMTRILDVGGHASGMLVKALDTDGWAIRIDHVRSLDGHETETVFKEPLTSRPKPWTSLAHQRSLHTCVRCAFGVGAQGHFAMASPDSAWSVSAFDADGRPAERWTAPHAPVPYSAEETARLERALHPISARRSVEIPDFHRLVTALALDDRGRGWVQSLKGEGEGWRTEVVAAGERTLVDLSGDERLLAVSSGLLLTVRLDQSTDVPRVALYRMVHDDAPPGSGRP